MCQRKCLCCQLDGFNCESIQLRLSLSISTLQDTTVKMNVTENEDPIKGSGQSGHIE